MVLTLIDKKDCVGGVNVEKVEKKKVNYIGKKIGYRDRKRCFKCGHDNGEWYEYLVKGNREYHFLCRGCINIIEGRK